MTHPCGRCGLVAAYAGKRSHCAPLHRRVLHHQHPGGVQSGLFHQRPAEAGVFTTVGRLILNVKMLSRNVPEFTGDVCQNSCLSPPGGGYPVIAGVFRNRGVEEGRRVTDPAADDQRNTLFSRVFTGSINRGDHRITRQNHQINGLIVLIVVLSKPRPNGIHGVEGCARQTGEKCHCHRYLLTAYRAFDYPPFLASCYGMNAEKTGRDVLKKHSHLINMRKSYSLEL